MVWHDCGAAKFKATKHNLIWKDLSMCIKLKLDTNNGF